MTDKEIINGPVVDPTVARHFTSHLLQAYEEFLANFDGNITYAEGMMAAHNFHVYVIESLVLETGNPLWRNGALTTFERRMNNPNEYDTKWTKEEE